jgi:hypothetical protein
MIDIDRFRELARDRKRRQRERDRLRLVTPPSVTPDVTDTACTQDHADYPYGPPYRWALTLVAVVLFGAAIAANAEYAWSLGASPISSVVFCAIGVAGDCLVFLLPLAVSRSPLPIAVIGWAV